MSSELSNEMLGLMDAYGAQRTTFPSDRSIYETIPLLREPLRLEHVKRTLLGHWGTTPGQTFIYVHLNRLINEHDLNMIYFRVPGTGGSGAGR